jgi:hypothetical protein
MLFSEKKSYNHAAMRCKTTVRHLLRPWYFVLTADMRWVVAKLKGALAPQSKKEPSNSGRDDEQSEPLGELTNEELLAYGTALGSVTLLENELLHRLEAYVDAYGDFLEPPSPRANIGDGNDP